MKRALLSICTLLCCISPLFAQIHCELSDNKHVPWIGTLPESLGKDYRFAVIADNTGGERNGVLDSAIVEINALAPDFVICIGDLIDGYVNDRKRSASQWDNILKRLGKLQAPMFLVGGNHDLSNQMLREDWENRFGRTYYHFKAGDDLFIVLDTEEGGCGISPEQASYFKNVIDSFDGRWIYVFMHRSLWIDKDCGISDILESLDKHRHTVFSGHEHAYYMEERKGMQYIQVATTGGSSELRGAHVGEFDHFMFVTARNNGPVIANIRTGSQLPVNIVNPSNYPYVRTLLGSSYASIPDIVLPDATVMQFTLNVEAHNPMDSPMYFSASIPETDGFAFSETEVRRTISPHARVSIPITVSNLHNIPAWEYPWFQIRTICAYDIGGELVSIPMWRHLRVNWPFRVPMHITCKAPDNIREDWDWHGFDDGYFDFSIYVKGKRLIISARMHDDIYIPQDSDDPSKPCDKIDIFLSSGGSDYSWTLFSDGEISVDLDHIKDSQFMFNISFTDCDDAHNTKPSVIWWKTKAVSCTL